MTSKTSKRTIRVAGIQAVSRNGDPQKNLERAEPLVARAAERGAELVLCPEFLATGYIYDPDMWQSAEPQHGRTEQWLTIQAKRHHIYIGASYLEARGEDFYNTFTLVAPNGTIAGRVSKESLPFFEGWFFKSCDAPKHIDTDLGRIAVGICHDNHTARFMERLRRGNADLLLMPHSGPCVADPTNLIDKNTRRLLRGIGAFYAKTFGIPTVMVNKAADRDIRTPVPLLPWVRMRMRFPGLSSVCNADGEVLHSLGDEEDIVVADITIDPDKRRTPDPPTGYWSDPPLTLPRLSAAVMQWLERLGQSAYSSSQARAKAARAVATTSGQPITHEQTSETTP
jgi:N-carbamoylputrescine amidase